MKNPLLEHAQFDRIVLAYRQKGYFWYYNWIRTETIGVILYFQTPACLQELPVIVSYMKTLLTMQLYVWLRLNGNFVSDKQKSCFINPIALRTAKTLWSFGLSECNRDAKRAHSDLALLSATEVQRGLIVIWPYGLIVIWPYWVQ